MKHIRGSRPGYRGATSQNPRHSLPATGSPVLRNRGESRRRTGNRARWPSVTEPDLPSALAEDAPHSRHTRMLWVLHLCRCPKV